MSVAEPAATQRLFIGIPVDDDCQQQLDALLLPLQEPLAGLRWQLHSNRHLTLAFLGEVSAQDAQCLLQALPHEVVPFTLWMTALARFPDVRGKIFAATAEASPLLLALHQQVETVLVQCGITYAEQGRPLRPHITLARVPASFRTVLPQQTVALPLQVSRVHLYASEVIDGQRVYRMLGL